MKDLETGDELRTGNGGAGHTGRIRWVMSPKTSFQRGLSGASCPPARRSVLAKDRPTRGLCVFLAGCVWLAATPLAVGGILRVDDDARPAETGRHGARRTSTSRTRWQSPSPMTRSGWRRERTSRIRARMGTQPPATATRRSSSSAVWRCMAVSMAPRWSFRSGIPARTSRSSAATSTATTSHTSRTMEKTATT